MRSVLRYCALLVLAAVPGRALGQLTTYDTFNNAKHLLNAEKWGGFETNVRDLEASRLIDAGKLRLLYRGYGGTSSDSGITVSSFGLFFPNDPNTIAAIQAEVQVVDVQAQDCPGNIARTAGSEARVDLRGSFFNSGVAPVDQTNDVHAEIVITRQSTDPANILQVVGEMFQCTSPTCSTIGSFVQKSLGSITCPGRICPTETLLIQWEQTNHLFRFRRTDALGPVEDTIPYGFSDTSSPSFGFKTIDIFHIVENCTAGRKNAFMEALIDNVQTD